MPPAPEGPTSRLRGLAGRADVALILTTLGAAALRFWRIGNASLWYDEWVTADDVHHRLAEMVISVLPYSEGSPPLYFVLQWLWLPIAGRDEAALRSLAALIGVATVPMMYALVRELGQSRRAARIAALIVATNPLLVWYSREARPYSLLALTATISLFFCVRAVRRGGPRDFLWWGLAAAAALSSHYFAAFLILPEIVWLFRTHRGRPLAWGCLPLAVVSVPLAVLALRQQGVNQAWIADFPLGLRLGELGRHLVLGPAEPFDAWWPVAVVLAGVVAIVLVRRGEPGEGRSAAIMVGVGASGLLLALIAAAIGSDYILGRNFLASFVPMLAALAIGLGARRFGRVGIALALVLCLAWTAVVVETAVRTDLQKPDWQAAARVLAAGGADRAVVVDSYLGVPLLRYVEHSHAMRGHRRFRVRRIDLLYRIPKPGARCGRWSGLACEVFLFPLLPERLGKSFPLVDRVKVAGFIINRYEANRPVSVTRRELLGAHPPRGSYVLVPHRLRRSPPDHRVDFMVP
ncbi:MAG: glycosyltransferase family 39 protein [Acidimicrobiia bacterium]